MRQEGCNYKLSPKPKLTAMVCQLCTTSEDKFPQVYQSFPAPIVIATSSPPPLSVPIPDHYSILTSIKSKPSITYTKWDSISYTTFTLYSFILHKHLTILITRVKYSPNQFHYQFLHRQYHHITSHQNFPTTNSSTTIT